MPPRERARDRGLRRGRSLLSVVATELREARIAAGSSQSAIGRAAGLTQSQVSRTERAQGSAVRVDDLAAHAAALGLRVSIKLYPEGSPVRDVAQLRLLEKLRAEVGTHFVWRSEVPIGPRHDLRAWDVLLDGTTPVAVDAETRLRDMQALQRRLELKWRDSGVPRIVLLVAGTRFNRKILREHRLALASTLPLDSPAIIDPLRRGEAPAANGILVL